LSVSTEGSGGCFFPCTNAGSDDLCRELLGNASDIFYEMDLDLTEYGAFNLIRILYHNETWFKDGFSQNSQHSIRHHIDKKFTDSSTVKFYFMDNVDEEKIVIVKSRIRKLYNKGNSPVHINDTHEQTMDISNIVLYENGLDWLNYAKPIYYKRFESLLNVYKQKLGVYSSVSRDYVIDGSAPLALYGLRDVADLDYLTVRPDDGFFKDDLISNHEHDLDNHAHSLELLTFDPLANFNFLGIKFISLDSLRKMKSKRGEVKDYRDIELIDGCYNKRSLSLIAILKSLFIYLRYISYRLKVSISYRISLLRKLFFKR